MPDGPWRCSECGTVNEPVANSCRTCGRWPSLFDLEASTLESPEDEDPRERAGAWTDSPDLDQPEVGEPDAFEQEPFAPEPFEPDRGARTAEEPDPFVVEPVDEEPGPRGRNRRRLASILVPLAFFVYFVVSAFLGDR